MKSMKSMKIKNYIVPDTMSSLGYIYSTLIHVKTIVLNLLDQRYHTNLDLVPKFSWLNNTFVLFMNYTETKIIPITTNPCSTLKYIAWHFTITKDGKSRKEAKIIKLFNHGRLMLYSIWYILYNRLSLWI